MEKDQQTSISNLSSNEREALVYLLSNGGSILTSQVPDKSEKDCLGSLIPGHSLFKKLEKKDLVYYTIEDPICSDPTDPLCGFCFTDEIYLTEQGRQIAMSFR